MQDPERYLELLDIRVACMVRGDRPARLDSTMRAMIGHDIFFFSDQRSRRRFFKNPLHYCRRLTDPVTLERFTPDRGSPSLVHRARRYYFADRRSLARFQTHPDSFAVRRGM